MLKEKFYTVWDLDEKINNSCLCSLVWLSMKSSWSLSLDGSHCARSLNSPAHNSLSNVQQLFILNFYKQTLCEMLFCQLLGPFTPKSFGLDFQTFSVWSEHKLPLDHISEETAEAQSNENRLSWSRSNWTTVPYMFSVKTFFLDGSDFSTNYRKFLQVLVRNRNRKNNAKSAILSHFLETKCLIDIYKEFW